MIKPKQSNPGKEKKYCIICGGDTNNWGKVKYCNKCRRKKDKEIATKKPS